ncbi:Low-density lipoprotein receptor-related protein 1 [Holothuria leucospilota]|uniref:Low-density lipoprotein receptor-related protein 1 n=1 Tax=Holothuria leucospilota TaxID=206669 RepID=A0A9Q1BAE7_HOLLE|nr:Low-density lipoprotein receptor-related protein 1 [Holothuria leucospilota]
MAAEKFRITTLCTGDGYEFQCGDEFNSCIYGFFLCDGIIDCPNGADEDSAICQADWEKLCEKERRFPNAKPFEMATCNNTMCITECDLCDGYYIDCADGSDEDPVLCSGENRPQINGDCSSYRESYPIPTAMP